MDKSDAIRIARSFAELIKAKFDYKQVVLFGSYAKGTADEWSDIDLALVTDDFIGDSFDFRFMLAKLARSIDPDIEPHPYLISEFNESNPVAGEILKNGERLF